MPQIPYRTAPAPASSQISPDLGMWKDRRSQAKQGRQDFEAIWHLCQAFISNRQWVGWSERQKRVVIEPNPSSRERHTVNVLTQYLMTNVGKFMSDDMLPRLLMRNDSREDEEYAEQANRAVEYAWYEEIQAEDRIYDAILKMATYGLAGVQCQWDSQHGPVLYPNVPFQGGKPMLDASAFGQNGLGNGPNGQVEMRDVRGCLSWRVLSPFNILPPPGVEHEREFPWLVIERPVPISTLVNVFGDQARGLSEESIASAEGSPGLGSGESAAVAQNGGRLRNHVMLNTGYEMPTRDHPKGRSVVWAGDRQLDQRDQLPYSIDGYPMIGIRFFKYHRIPGRFWPIGMVEPGIGPQRQRNRSRSQYIEIKDRAGLGRVYARPNSLKVAQVPGGKLMEVIEVRMGSEMPVETAGTGPGAWIAQDVAMHDADLDKVMGMGQASLGQAPGGVSAYSAMALLAEQDDKRVGPVLKQVREEIKWLTKFTLQDIRTYWGPKKQIMLAGSEEDSLDAFSFDASKLPANIYVKVGSGPPVPRSQAAEIQKIFDLYDRSVSSGQPLGPQWLQESLDAGKAMKVPETDQQIQTEKAEIENFLIARGGAVQVSMYDNHQLHIAEHGQAVAQHALIEGAEDVIRALQEHIQEHQEAMKEAAPGTNMPSAQGAQGAAGGATTPGAPEAPPDVPIAFANRLSPRPGMVQAGQ